MATRLTYTVLTQSGLFTNNQSSCPLGYPVLMDLCHLVYVLVDILSSWISASWLPHGFPRGIYKLCKSLRFPFLQLGFRLLKHHNLFFGFAQIWDIIPVMFGS